MSNLPNREKCCGCLACKEICPRGCIESNTDSLGFKYPVVDEDKCTNCGLCSKACPILNRQLNNDATQKYYAAFNKDDEILVNSSSGGVFFELCRTIINRNGIVYGVALDGAEAVYKRADNMETVRQFMGSKYIQAYIGTSLKLIKEDLGHGLDVLVSGTPCAVSGIINYLKAGNVDISKLVCVDFVCHGVSSPKLFKDYINYIEGKEGAVSKYAFRGKAEGWHNWYPTIIAGGKDVSKKYKKQGSYINMYSTLYFNRDSCFNCQYTDYSRAGDITLADFWNVDTIDKKMDNYYGTSQVLINNDKGINVFDAASTNLAILEVRRENVWQPHLEYPNAVPAKKEEAVRYYENESFADVIKRYGKGSLMSRIKSGITPVIKKLGLYTIAGKMYKAVFVRSKK